MPDAPAKMAIFGISLEETAVPSGARPRLPDNSLGVTGEEAISGALPLSRATDQSGQLNPRVQVSAAYGLVTDTKRRTMHSGDGPGALIYDRRPAWVVTFTGPGVLVMSHGPPTSTPMVHQEMTVVLDAKTGARLFAIS